jgi:excinuclease ABC subunit A
VESLSLRGARQNNLKGVDLDLPLGRMIVVTGPSGSGKSSLAFDTIYAEGQRRYVETFSPYTRQFLDRMDKPLVDSIEGIPPAIAIEQANNVRTTRSTVGTITEINDYLKLLFPRVARGVCPSCHRTVKPETAQAIQADVLKAFRGSTVLVTFGVAVPPGTESADFFAFLKQQGYLRVWVGGKIVRTDGELPAGRLPAVVSVVQDRIDVTPGNKARLSEAVETALRLGNDRVTIVEMDGGKAHPYSSGWHCAHCDLGIRPPSPGLFSFNNPLGACPDCRGFGRIIGLDWNRVMPDRSLSIREGVVKAFQTGQSVECQNDLIRHARRREVDISCPFEDLPKADQDWVIEGEGDRGEAWENGTWYGVRGYFEWLESKTYKMHIRVLLSRYRSYQPCPACHGGRFQPEALNFRIGNDLTIAGMAAKPVSELAELIDGIKIPAEDTSACLVRDQIRARLGFLEQVGLGYLTLGRPTRSLSGGEIQRVNLTTCLGASLVNTLFVLDEPSVGLHPRDTERLLGVLRSLRDKGNTLLVVEHEEAVIRAADHLVDIGPGRGSAGGTLLYSGPAAGFLGVDSLTCDYLEGRRSIAVPVRRRKPRKFVELRGIRHHNLRNINVKIPLLVFCAVTGVSGSGKTSLIRDVLHRQLSGEDPAEDEAAGHVKSIKGDDGIDEIVMVDQSPLARSPRSTPAVYLGAYDGIRELFGTSKAALAAGLSPGSFSFNSGTGRCERCGGLGFEKVEMQFLSDLFLRCPECEGRRFRPPVLNIRVGGKSIHEVLEMTARDAIAFFEPLDPKGAITRPLCLLAEVGLDYLRLGQPVNALSGGESQRLKLVHHLAAKRENGAMLIFDEPTTGLHFDDVALLLKVFQRLVEEGNSVVVIEHNLDVIKSADWVLDLGPEAGDAGGRVVAAGTPEAVAGVTDSHTGRFLKQVLGPRSPIVAQSPAIFRPSPDLAKVISVRGAREHNLKNLSVDIPRDGMVVITGLSGSGKSTLAFDILFAEGQRRFLDSMSPYARQFVEQMEKPEVDAIEGLPPTVAIEQRVTRGGGKSTVATVTEIHHFLRLLFSKLGTQYCPDCRVPVESRTRTAIAEAVCQQASKGRVKVFANLVRARKGFHTDVARAAARQGISTLIVDGKPVAVEAFEKLERFKEHTIDALVGELDKPDANQADEVVRRALLLGRGTARSVDSRGNAQVLSTEMNCPSCSRAFEPLDPRLFSFNSPHGWCLHCRGFGEVWSGAGAGREFETQIEAELDEEKRHEGLEDDEPRPCPVCSGSRLNDTAANVFLQELTITDFTKAPASDALQLVGKLKFTGAKAEIARDVLAEIAQRLEFLSTVGLDYLSLDRGAKTLSGGEAQRIRLAAQLGSNLRGVLYVLDEPTIGLHPRDNARLLEALATLTGKGNSVVVVEHDEETMRRADRILDLGPGAGRRGGEIVASGTLEEIMRSPDSLTGRSLRDPMPHPSRGARRPPAGDWVVVRGARLHNLKSVDVALPVNRLTVITGVSGSGKSTLLRGVVVPAVREAVSRSRVRAPLANCDGVDGIVHLGAVLEVDQSPIGKTSRSTPATYVKVFDEIRALFSTLPASRMRGYTNSRFSFNNEGGRCEACLGQGVVRLEMNFLPPSYMPCQDCLGRRYNPATLEVEYNGKSIGDVMDMTIEQAAEFFSAHPKIRRPLDLLVETGLGYLQLGQPSPTLSGGEAQRIKLVTQLARRSTSFAEEIRTTRRGKSTLYVLEEPTIGLHAHDVGQLVAVLHRLVDEGGTVVVIEHHLDVIAEADHVIDVGPEAGREGGRIVVEGSPEDVAGSKSSRTAPFLSEVLAKSKASKVR